MTFGMVDRTAKGKVWGSDEVNVEGWKPLKRLPGHDSGMSHLILKSQQTPEQILLRRRHGLSLVTGRQIPRIRRIGFLSDHMVRIYPRCVP